MKMTSSTTKLELYTLFINVSCFSLLLIFLIAATLTLGGYAVYINDFIVSHRDFDLLMHKLMFVNFTALLTAIISATSLYFLDKKLYKLKLELKDIRFFKKWRE